MELDSQQVIDLIKSMQDSQNKQYDKMDDHLTKLRENVHDIRNEYHGQSQLTQIIHRDVEDIKRKQEIDFQLVHARIDKHSAKSDIDIDLLKKQIDKIRPMAESWNTVYSHGIKVLVGAVVIGAIAIVSKGAL